MAYNIKNTKIKTVRLEAFTDGHGQVVEKAVVVLSDGEQAIMSKKAIWGWLRFHYNRKDIDQELKGKRDEVPQIFAHKFVDELQTETTQRELQFIVEDIEDTQGVSHKEVIAVATKDHPVTNPAEVEATAEEILLAKGFQIQRDGTLKGFQAIYKKTDLFEYGLQVYGGDITTSQAICVSSFLRVNSCLNPLSFLGLKQKFLAGVQNSFNKILRYEVATQIPARIQQAITHTDAYVQGLNGRIDKSTNTKIDVEQARTLLLAFGGSYAVGKKAILKSLDRWVSKEEHTIYGLSMATSWIAKHTDNVFKEDAVSGKQNLSTISGALLLIDNLQDTVAKCNEHIKSVPALQEIKAEIIMGQK